MTGFEDGYIGQIRSLIGARLLRVPGTRIVLENETGEILLQRRGDFAVWGLPGGSGEIGECVEDTIRREVFEETGLTLGKLVPMGFASSPKYEVITFPNGHVCHFHSLVFTSTEFNGTLADTDSETEELRWFRADDRPSMLSNMSRTIDAFIEFKRTGLFQVF